MKVFAGQSIFDIAIQHCGAIEAAFQIALKNDIGLTDNLTVGAELASAEIINRDVFNYFARRGLQPATETTNDSLSKGIFDNTFDNTFN